MQKGWNFPSYVDSTGCQHQFMVGFSIIRREEQSRNSWVMYKLVHETKKSPEIKRSDLRVQFPLQITSPMCYQQFDFNNLRTRYKWKGLNEEGTKNKKQIATTSSKNSQQFEKKEKKFKCLELHLLVMKMNRIVMTLIIKAKMNRQELC